MAKITLTYKTIEPKVLDIPDAAVPRIIEGFAIVGNYQANLVDTDEEGNQIVVPNPVTKQQFFIDGFSEQIKKILLDLDALKVERDAIEAAKNEYVAPNIK